MAAPTKPVRDAELAGEFARKFFGKFGYAKTNRMQARSIGRAFDVYQVGVMSPQGDFLVKGDSSHDFAEAFQHAGKFIDDRDPIWLRHAVKGLAKAQEPKPEQVEMFA